MRTLYSLSQCSWMFMSPNLHTWEAAADEVNPPVLGGRRRKGSDIIPAAGVGPVFREHLLGITVNLHFPSRLEAASPLQPKFNATKTSEQTAYHQHRYPPGALARFSIRPHAAHWSPYSMPALWQSVHVSSFLHKYRPRCTPFAGSSLAAHIEHFPSAW